MPGVATIDGWDAARARRELSECCGATRWVDGMLERRPFRSREGLITAAADAWNALGPADWLEAFTHHPRIGARVDDAVGRSGEWSSKEQGSVATAPDAVKAALASGNEDYEHRFGFTYIVCATGKSAEEMLALLRSRLGNPRDEELRVAAGEQRKIMMLRLEKLLAAA